MNITLYQTNSDKERVNKVLENPVALTGNLRGECSVLDPVIRVSGDVGLVRYNYAYIPDFGRYYYIRDIVGIRNGVMDISMFVDVLMSYKDQLQKCKVITSRQQNVFNWYLPDPVQIAKVNGIVTTQLADGADGNFSVFSGQGMPEYVLTVAGGK